MKKTMVRALSLALTVLMMMGTVVLYSSAATITKVEIHSYPRTVYKVGETALDTNGLTLDVTDSDNNVTQVVKGITCTGFKADKAGTVTITVTCEGSGNVGTTFDITVVDVREIEVETPPKTTTYKVGEKFDPKGMKVKVYYDDPTETIKPEIITEGFECEYDFSKKGLGIEGKKVTVIYKDKKATTPVDVIDLESIVVRDAPATTYKVGESFDPSGMTLTATYTDTTTKKITKGFTWEYADSRDSLGFVNVGKHVIKVSYADKAKQSTYLEVFVEPAQVRGVTAKNISMLWGTTTVVQPLVEGEVGMEYDIEYSAADENIVKVGTDGKVIARGVGKTTITVTVWEKYSTYKDGKKVGEEFTGNAKTCDVDVSVKFTPIPWIYNSLFSGLTEFLVECVIYHIPFLYKLITK